MPPNRIQPTTTTPRLVRRDIRGSIPCNPGRRARDRDERRRPKPKKNPSARGLRFTGTFSAQRKRDPPPAVRPTLDPGQTAATQCPGHLTKRRHSTGRTLTIAGRSSGSRTAGVAGCPGHTSRSAAPSHPPCRSLPPGKQRVAGRQWHLQPIRPITAAGPRWILTTLPFSFREAETCNRARLQLSMGKKYTTPPAKCKRRRPPEREAF